jgi:hypothetical protein
MNFEQRLFGRPPDPDDDAWWAASGAMALTGHANGPNLLPPRTLVPFLRAVAEVIEELTARHGSRVSLDTGRLLGERAVVGGLRRRGRRSCGDASGLLRATDDWIAVSLARPDDLELVPAWLGTADVASGVGRRAAAELVTAAAELGLPCARLGEVNTSQRAVTATPLAAGPAGGSLADITVVDLSSLWAGPLCGHVLTAAGARTIKVESATRPDGARNGPAEFYDLLHAGQESVVLDFGDADGRQRLRALLERADVVIEASRPRALAELGIDAAAVAAASPAVWVSITGYGRTGLAANRVAFGDDAAVAGGLVCDDGEAPVFCADAIADPLAGLAAAAAALAAIAAGGGWLVDVSMAAVAAWCARLGPSGEPWRGTVAAPRARRPAGRAAQLGRDNDRVLAGFAR